MSDRPKVFVSYLHPGMVAHGFMFSIIRMINTPQPYEPHLIGQHSGVSIAKHRNRSAALFLNSPCDYWLSLDADACFDPAAVTQLLKHNVPIVGGHAMGMDYGKEVLFSAVLGFNPDGSIGRIPAGEGLTKVAAVGMHFTLVRRDVCEALGVRVGWPFAESMLANNDGKEQHLGEDSTFCMRAGEHGFATYIDFDCPIGHIKQRTLWPPGVGDEDPMAPLGLPRKVDPTSQLASYGSHMEALRWAVENTEGPILEVGGGNFSTPYLVGTGRELTTVEEGGTWRDGLVEHYPDLNIVETIPDGHFSVVLIDNDPEDLRPGTLESLRGRFDVAVIHDIWPEGGRSASYADWGAIAQSFESHFFYLPEAGGPPTLVVSERDLDVVTIPGGQIVILPLT